MNISIHKEVQCMSSRLSSIANTQVKSIKACSGRVKLEIEPDFGYWISKRLLFEIKTKDYPTKPCKVICKTKILHPNILEIDGEVCLSMFDEDWQPTMRLEHYLSGILFVLHNPNFDDPLSDYFCIAREQGKIKQAIESLAQLDSLINSA